MKQPAKFISTNGPFLMRVFIVFMRRFGCRSVCAGDLDWHEHVRAECFN
jgi:hypothetical protein